MSLSSKDEKIIGRIRRLISTEVLDGGKVWRPCFLWRCPWVGNFFSNFGTILYWRWFFRNRTWVKNLLKVCIWMEMIDTYLFEVTCGTCHSFVPNSENFSSKKDLWNCAMDGLFQKQNTFLVSKLFQRLKTDFY